MQRQAARCLASGRWHDSRDGMRFVLRGLCRCLRACSFGDACLGCRPVGGGSEGVTRLAGRLLDKALLLEVPQAGSDYLGKVGTAALEAAALDLFGEMLGRERAAG